MTKIISNKYFLFTLLFLYNCVAFAHDCSSPGDCEETAGYNAALAITGGVIALGAGLISTWLPPEVPDVPESDFESEFGEAFDDEFDEEFSEEFDEDNEDKFDEDEFDSDEDDEYDEDEFDSDEDNKEDYDASPKAKEPHAKEEVKKEVISEAETTDIASDVLDKTQFTADYLNNIKTIIDKTGDAGAKLGKAGIMLKDFVEGNKIEKAAIKFKNIVTKNKALTNLVSKIGNKIDSVVKSDIFKTLGSKAKGVKDYIGGVKNLGHLADGLTFLNNLNKKLGGARVTELDEKIGAVAEETARFAFKTFVTKNPIVAVGDAALSLAGGPNLDYVVDKTIDNYKKGVTKITDWVYSDHKTAYAKLNSDFDFQKKRIEKMNLSPLEKGKKLRKVWKILKKSHQL